MALHLIPDRVYLYRWQRLLWRLAFIVGVSYSAYSPAEEVQDSEWVGSTACQSCHRGRFATWHRSFHRSMTQEALAETVLGDFNGEAQSYWGGVIKPVKRDGRYFFEYYLPGSEELLAEYEITRTVGSHRYQQYLAKTPQTAGTYYRLHLLWHIEDQRWVHMNGVFLGPDSQHFDAQVSVWNQNCIFCHNTGPEPNILNLNELQLRAASGQAVDSSTQSIFDSSVAELGIACETCHGPGREHIEKNQNPLRRLWASLTGEDDSIIHPTKLEQDRSVQICGQCHGQRVANSQQEVLRWVQQGPSYRAGDDLLESVNLVNAETQIPGDLVHDRFARRFWKEGTPRLSAYEYQGVLLSACYQDSAFTCSSCHQMHAGERAGMMTAAMKAGQACKDCHTDIAAQPTAHSRHAKNSEGNECVNCHMPRVNYGVMSIHRSHRIEIPDPAAHAQAGRPNACNQCHLDQSPQWAAQQMVRLWPDYQSQVNTAQWQRDDGASIDLAAGIAALYAGDPVQRALAAEAIGLAVADENIQAQEWIPHLLVAMTDNYPAVRRFASRSLQQSLAYLPLSSSELNAIQSDDQSDKQTSQNDRLLLSAIQAFNFIADQGIRNQQVAILLQLWNERAAQWKPSQRRDLLLTPNYLPDERVDDLQALGFQRSAEISIGE